MAAEPGPKQLVTLLEAAPQRLAAATSGAPRRALHTPPEPGEWSATEVLAHMRACSDMWGGAILSILNDRPATLRAVNPVTWIKSTDYPDLDFQQSLRAYTAQRETLASVLRSLPAQEWERSVLVTGGGTPLRRSALDYARRLARHERPHLKQIAASVKTLSRPQERP